MESDLAIIFAYHFPPQNAIGALRPFRFYKYLSRMGYRCHVISAAEVTDLPEIAGTYVRDPFEETPRDGMGWQIERAVRKFLLPGVTGSQWSALAYRAGLKFLQTNPAARITIFSTSPPLGAHAAAYWLARRTKLPWIADCRDPIAGNPALNEISGFAKSLYEKVERRFIGAADTTIANTDTAQECLRKKYPDRANRIELIWNGFDPEDRLTPLPPASSGRKIIAHVGQLYGGRTVTPILESLRRSIDRGHLNAAHFQVVLAGLAVANSLPTLEFLEAATRQGWLRIDDRVPLSDAHKIVQSANALLLIQPHSALQVPGKLFEYLQIGRPILGFVPPHSPVEKILQKSGVPYTCVYPDADAEDFDRAIREFFLLDDKTVQPSDWFDEHFNVRNHATKLAQIIEAVHRERSSPRQREAILASSK
jgi:glycosyltransferase involved in cell wall biosynthesis